MLNAPSDTAPGESLSHTDEYTAAMPEAMDLIRGEGFLAPGGEGHVRQMVRGPEPGGRRSGGAREPVRFVEAWRLLARSSERGEVLQVYTQARQPGH